MSKRDKPAVDTALTPRHGVSRGGQPLSYNRAPAADLAPWIAWLYVTVVDVPADYHLECGLFNEVTVFRFQLKGEWTAQTADGPMALGKSALLFGPQSHRMPISVTGSFISIGMALRPGTGHALLGAQTADLIDRVVTCDDLGLPGNALLAQLKEDGTPEEWLQVLEAMIRQVVAEKGGARPDEVTSKFETLALIDPSRPVADFAAACGITQRQLERIVSRDFGMSPKQQLRRARALDMAAQLRGVGDTAEADEVALRFYDQSHMTREFTQLFGMSPGQFRATPQPLLTLAIESRQAHRLEAIERLAPGAKRPWE